MRVIATLFCCFVALSSLSTCKSERVFEFPSQYWYDSDMFCGPIFVGMVEIVSSGTDFNDVTVIKYKFRVTEILGDKPAEQARYQVGDIFVSETYRKISNGKGVICLGAYPTENEPMIDGAFPLMLSPEVKAALGLVRKHGTDPTKFSDNDFRPIAKNNFRNS
jgi:hypothetical protein